VLYTLISRNDRLDRRLLLGVLGGFAGLSLIVGFGGSVGRGASLPSRLGGDLGALVTASTWAFYSHLLRPMTRKYSPLRITAYVMTVGAVGLMPLGLIQQASQGLPSWHNPAWLGFLYATFLSVAFTNVLWFTAIRRQGATRALVYTYLEPFLGVLFAELTLGERAQAAQWLGGLVVVGAVLLSRAPRAEAAASPLDEVAEPPPA
jgi:drug/metabolite transporter (DMT)-like permease